MNTLTFISIWIVLSLNLMAVQVQKEKPKVNFIKRTRTLIRKGNFEDLKTKEEGEIILVIHVTGIPTENVESNNQMSLPILKNNNVSYKLLDGFFRHSVENAKIDYSKTILYLAFAVPESIEEFNLIIPNSSTLKVKAPPDISEKLNFSDDY